MELTLSSSVVQGNGSVQTPILSPISGLPLELISPSSEVSLNPSQIQEPSVIPTPTEEHAAHPIGLNWQIVVKAGKRYATYFCFLPLVTN